MAQNILSQASLFAQLLHTSENSPAYKQVIAKAAKGVEERTFWYFTADDAEFLGNVYNRKLDGQILKNRIRQITDEKMSEVLEEIASSKLVKIKGEEEKETLQVQVDVRDIFEVLPQGERSDRGKENIRQINEDFRKFRKFKEKMEEIRRFQEMKKGEKAALQEEFKKSLENEQREEHRQEIRKKIESLKQTEEERRQSNEKFKDFLKEFKKTKPLHVLMEEQYREKVELPKIEESRRKLEMLTHRKKPTLEEINMHDRLYIQSKTNRPERIVQSQTIDVSFKSHFYLQEEERLRERDEFQENGPQWDFLEKQKRYSQFVKDKVRPKISKKLKESLQESLVRKEIEVPDRSKIIEVGKGYLEFMRNLEKNRRSATPNKPIEQTKQSRYINYLQEMKGRSEHSHTSLDWERDLKDRTASKMEKRERILMKSKQLEERAMRDEIFVANHNYGRAEEIINKKKEIDETLLSSIKAKVAVLRDARED